MKRLGAFFQHNSGGNYLMPCALRTGFLANLVLFYLGLAYVESPARRCGFMLLCGLFALLCVMVFIKNGKHFGLRRWFYALLALWLVFFVGNILYAVLVRPDKYYVNQAVKQFTVLCIPAFLAGVIGAREGQGAALFETMERLSFFVIPAAVLYFFGALFNCSGFEERQLGVIGYMNLAYGFAPFMLSHMVRFLDGKPWQLPIVGRPVRRAELWRGLFIFVYWIDILASGTRGCMLAVLAFAVFVIVYRLLRREKTGRFALLSLALVAVLAFLMLVYCPPGIWNGLSRMSSTLTRWKDGEISTAKALYSPEDYGLETDEFVALMVAADDDQQVTRRREEDRVTPEQLDFELTPDTIDDINYWLGDRILMYRIAWAEFLNEPLYGLGGMGSYSAKYGVYPHNVPLEALCELGLAGVVLLLVIAYCLIKLFIIGLHDQGAAEMLMLLVFCMVHYLFSGSLWMSESVQLAVGFGLAYPWPKPTAKELSDGRN